MVRRILLLVVAASGLVLAWRALHGPFYFLMSVRSPMNAQSILGIAVTLLLAWAAPARERALEQRPWVLDQAGDLAELERTLNHLDEEGFRLYSLHQILVGMGPAFVIVAFRLWSRIAPWLEVAGTAIGFTLLCFPRRFLS